MQLVVITGFVAVLSIIVLLIGLKNAKRLDLLDKPNLARKTHLRNIPLLGGSSLIFVFVFSLSLAFVQGISVSWKFPLALIIVFIVGLVDDIRDVHPYKRMFVQLAVAALLISDQHNVVHNIHHFSLGVLAKPLSALFIVGAINAFNLIDGIDGLAGGIALTGLAALAYLAFGHCPLLFIVSWCGCVGLVVYLSFNLSAWGQHRQVFLGDSGSTLLGLVLSWGTLESINAVQINFSAIDGLALLFIPVMDTIFVMVRRIVRGVSPFCGDRNHLHHLLIRLGFSGRQALLAILCVSIGLNLLVIFEQRDEAILLAMSLCVIIYWLLVAVSERLIQTSLTE